MSHSDVPIELEVTLDIQGRTLACCREYAKQKVRCILAALFSLCIMSGAWFQTCVQLAMWWLLSTWSLPTPVPLIVGGAQPLTTCSWWLESENHGFKYTSFLSPAVFC